MIKVILWDVDGTLLNFLLSEKNSLIKNFKKYSLGECTAEMVESYSKINIKHWEKLERGELTKEQVKVERFREFFDVWNIKSVSPSEFTTDYENSLCDTVEYIDGAKKTVSSLKGSFKQYAVTNGAYNVQSLKLKKSGLVDILDGVFISDEVGFEKPSREYFDYVLSHIEPCEREEILIVGDSLTSDMKGGNTAKIKCCWYNPDSKINNTDSVIDYEIKRISELIELLKAI